MRNFLRHLRAAWLYGRTFSYVEEADEASYWTHEDAQALESFFQSRAGRKLKIRLMNYVIKMALVSIRNPAATPYQNGQASGVSATIAAIEAHMPLVQPEQAEEEAELEEQLV